MEYGLIGEKLGHSFSPVIHKEFYIPEYGLMEIPKDEIDAFFEKADFNGANVTIPYKETAMKHCIPDETSKAIGCVNTLVKDADGLKGYNTDTLGFEYMVRRAGISFEGQEVVILGSGGTSKTACYTASKMGAKSIYLLSRSGKSYPIDVDAELTFLKYEDIDKAAGVTVLINTTPVGMYPNNYESPVELSSFPKLEAVVDVIYNPLVTPIVQEAKKRGMKTTNGLPMLVAQAYYAEQYFFHKEPSFSDEDMEKINRTVSVIEKSKKNIVLIGMAGCGKTTVGKILAEKENLQFADTDELFKDKFGIPAGEYIEKYGEPAFRDSESEVVKEISTKQGFVIATGGGAILRQENVDALKQNGLLVFIDRQLKELSSEGRPLSKGSEKKKALYYKRLPIYTAISDAKIFVDADAATIAERISNIDNIGDKKMKLLVINGPNLNMLGIREPGMYGSESYHDLIGMCENKAKELGVEAEFFQSNHEGDLVDKIQESYGRIDGIVINPGAYTHTSVAILDALKAVSIPTVEVHITDVDNRDEFRKISFIRSYVEKVITGHGLNGYLEAMEFLAK